jgi:tetratricopeptide (TPR) repeat protein
MRPWRIASAIAALSALCVPPAADAAASPSDADITKSFEARIAQLDALDPRAPQALETHLRYADYLAKTPGGNCNARLNTAQSQLQSARQNVAIDVVLAQGLARAADIEYQIHTALASCGGPPDASTQREPELRAALEAAQRAAALYKDSFDYPAMVTMQFNAAVTYQNLGDTAAAQSALKSVIEADREFGFHDDAEENYALLLRWTHADTDSDRNSGPEQVAALMQDFPQRSATLNFAWVPIDNPITLKTETARVIDNAVLRASGDRTLVRHVRRRHFGWTVTDQSLASH